MELVAQILHQIGIRWQLVVTQLLGFLIVLVVLKTLLFDRIHKVLADRAEEEARRKDAIAAAKKESAAAKGKLDARQAELDKQAYERTQAEVRTGAKRKADLVSEASERARKQLQEVRAALDKEHPEAIAAVKKEVLALSLFIGGKVTHRKLEADPEAKAVAEKEVASAIAAWEAGALGGPS